MIMHTKLEQLERTVRAILRWNELDRLRALLPTEHPADVADVIDRLDHRDQVTVFRLLPLQQAADVLRMLHTDATRELIKHLSPREAGGLLDRLPMDDVVEILTEDVPGRQHSLLEAMLPDRADRVRALLSYPTQSAGRLMTERFVRASPEMTVEQTIAHLRHIDPEVETLSNVYVLDSDAQLRGVLSLREIITAPGEHHLHEIMSTRLVTVAPETDQEEVARLVASYNFVAVPVTTPERQMLGIVTVDDVIDVFVQESTEDVLRFGAIEGGVGGASYFSVSVLHIVRQRVGWLLILFLTGTMTINVLGRFENELNQVVALSFFIPLLIGTGGNTGAQTVSTMIRGMALGDIRLGDGWRVFSRELGSGLLLGLLLAIVAFGFALALGNAPTLAAVVALSIIAICMWANVIGSLVPMVAQRLGLDPALVSAPLITTLVDATGLAIYLLIARALLGL